MSEKIKCPIWSTEADDYTPSGYGGKVIHSPRAGGMYKITIPWPAGSSIFTPLSEDIKIQLSGWIWQQNMERGIKEGSSLEDLPDINEKRIKESKSWRIPTVPERIEKLALCIFHLTNGIPGELIELNERDTNTDHSEYMKAASYCINHKGLGYLLLDVMLDDSLINCRVSDKDSTPIYLTRKGHELVEKARHKNIDSEQGFVAMWFDPGMSKLREAIKQGIKNAGYKPLIVDEAPGNNDITDQIIAEIRRSRFVIADFTCDPAREARGGVYYEAGFARGLNIPVIHVCRKDRLDNVHFDTRNMSHIVWEEGEYDALIEQITDRISATIGDGPHR